MGLWIHGACPSFCFWSEYPVSQILTSTIPSRSTANEEWVELTSSHSGFLLSMHCVNPSSHIFRQWLIIFHTASSKFCSLFPEWQQILLFCPSWFLISFIDSISLPLRCIPCNFLMTYLPVHQFFLQLNHLGSLPELQLCVLFFYSGFQFLPHFGSQGILWNFLGCSTGHLWS